MRTGERLLILCTLLVATGLRWQRPALVQYAGDEAYITGIAQRIAELRGYFPLLSGGTLLGIERSAFDAYLMAVPLLLAGRLEAAVLGVGAAGVVAVALTYALGRRVARALNLPGVGLVAALFMAANPWLVLLDRRLWAHIQVALSVALLLLAWEVVVERPTQKTSGRAARWFFVLAALQLLSHVLALVQALSWLGGWLSAPRRWWRGESAWGIVIALALLLPYGWALVGHVQRAGLPTPFRAIEWPTPWHVHLLNVRDWVGAYRLLAGTGIAHSVGLVDSANAWWQATDAIAAPMIMLLLIVGVLYTVWRAREQSEAGLGARLLLLWSAGPLLLLGLRPVTVYFQYWTVLLPLPALASAVGLCVLGDVLRRVAAPRAAWSVVGAVAGATVVIWTGSYLAQLDVVERGGGDATLHTWQQVTGAARELAQAEGTQEVRVAVRGVDPGYESEPAIVATLLGNPPFARFVAPTSPPALLLAHSKPSLYLWAIDAPQTEARLAELGEQVQQMPMTHERPPARLYRLPPADRLALGYTPLEPAPEWSIGMRLLGYTFEQDASTDAAADAQASRPITATLVWRVLEPPPAARERDFTAFNHILNTQEEMVTQTGDLALLSRDWWPGDVLVQPYLLELPPGTYTWRVGFYSRIDGERALTTAGGDTTDLPELVVR